MPEVDPQMIIHLQQQINELQAASTNLENSVDGAVERGKNNEERLIKLSEQVARMDGTILRMRADLPTKDDLNEALTTTLNKYIAKGFWAMLVLLIGTVVAWIANHLTLK